MNFDSVKVYKHSIGAACALEWSSDRLIIQVLDDSTDTVCKVIYLFCLPVVSIKFLCATLLQETKSKINFTAYYLLILSDKLSGINHFLYRCSFWPIK